MGAPADKVAESYGSYIRLAHFYVRLHSLYTKAMQKSANNKGHVLNHASHLQVSTGELNIIHLTTAFTSI